MNAHILVVDDEPDVEIMLRQHFRRDLRSDRKAELTKNIGMIGAMISVETFGQHI